MLVRGLCGNENPISVLVYYLQAIEIQIQYKLVSDISENKFYLLTGHIYTVTDRAFIKNANETTLSYDWRWSHLIPGSNKTLYGSRDQVTTAKFKGYSMRLKGLFLF